MQPTSSARRTVCLCFTHRAGPDTGTCHLRMPPEACPAATHLHARSLALRSLIRYIEPVPTNADGHPLTDPGAAAQKELRELSEQLADTQVSTFAVFYL